MSRQSNNARSNKGAKVAPAPKPYCAHCFNLGKPESAYTSHFIRASPDPKSPIVCPELLSTECRYCFKSGHTVGKCPVLAERKAAEEREAKQKEREERLAKQAEEQKKQLSAKKQSTKGKFAALESSDDDSEDEITLKVTTKITTKKMPAKPVAAETFEEKFPALPMKTKASSVAPALSNYAGMAAKSKSEYENEQFLKATMTKRVEMPILKRNTNIQEEQVSTGPACEFWKDFDSDFECEGEYAARKIAEEEEKKRLEEHKKKMQSMGASKMNWAALDSDDEDW